MSATVQTKPVAYRMNEAVRAIGLSKSTLYKLMREGELRSVKAHGCRFILREDLEALLSTRPAVGQGTAL